MLLNVCDRVVMKGSEVGNRTGGFLPDEESGVVLQCRRGLISREYEAEKKDFSLASYWNFKNTGAEIDGSNRVVVCTITMQRPTPSRWGSSVVSFGLCEFSTPCG